MSTRAAEEIGSGDPQLSRMSLLLGSWSRTGQIISQANIVVIVVESTLSQDIGKTSWSFSYSALLPVPVPALAFYKIEE